jgi:hypothetical protein
MRPSSGLAADVRAAPVSLGQLRCSHPRCTAPSSFRVVQQRLVPIAAATSSGVPSTCPLARGRIDVPCGFVTLSHH